MASANQLGDDVVVILSKREAQHLNAVLRSMGGTSKTRMLLTIGQASLSRVLSNLGHATYLMKKSGGTDTFFIQDDSKVLTSFLDGDEVD